METATAERVGHDAEHSEIREAPPQLARTRTVVLIIAVVATVLVVFLAIGIVARLKNAKQLVSAAAQVTQTPPSVMVCKPLATSAEDWSLPASTQAIQDSIIYARVSGYLAKRYVDIGDHVKADQLLAEIQSPELDQQLNQAKANVQQATKQMDLQKANMELARITMGRYKNADVSNAVSKEEVDQAVAGYATAQAAVAAAQAAIDADAAAVNQLEAMTAFERVLAPFDGTITQRNVDVGALITAGSPTNNTSVAPTSVTGTATGLFEVAQINTLRVFVSIPQAMAKSIHPGLAAQITVRGALTKPVAATVTRSADALDPATRTLLTEVDIPNSSHTILAGTFVYVAFKLAPSGDRWSLPATALVFNAQGTQVMIVDPANKLRIVPVTMGRDFGDTIDIQAGLTGNERVVAQPDVSMQDGESVTPVDSQPSATQQ